MSVLTYDPGAVTAIIGGYIAEGYSDGTFITVERNEDSWALKVGCDGIGTRAKSHNRSARITLTLHQSSKTNDELSALALADEVASTGSVPFFLRDASGRTVITALTCWIARPATAEFGKDVSNRVWVLESDNVQLFNGGNA